MEATSCSDPPCHREEWSCPQSAAAGSLSNCSQPSFSEPEQSDFAILRELYYTAVRRHCTDWYEI